MASNWTEAKETRGRDASWKLECRALEKCKDCRRRCGAAEQGACRTHHVRTGTFDGPGTFDVYHEATDTIRAIDKKGEEGPLPANRVQPSVPGRIGTPLSVSLRRLLSPGSRRSICTTCAYWVDVREKRNSRPGALVRASHSASKAVSMTCSYTPLQRSLQRFL